MGEGTSKGESRKPAKEMRAGKRWLVRNSKCSARALAVRPVGRFLRFSARFEPPRAFETGVRKRSSTCSRNTGSPPFRSPTHEALGTRRSAAPSSRLPFPRKLCTHTLLFPSVCAQQKLLLLLSLLCIPCFPPSAVCLTLGVPSRSLGCLFEAHSSTSESFVLINFAS